MTQKYRATRIEFELPGLPKTTNSGGRAHWAVKAKEAKRWSQDAMFASQVTIHGKNLRGLVPFKKAELTLIRCSSSEPDFDGLVSSFKHVIDGLVRAGVIENDKPSVIGQPKYLWERAKRGQGKIKVKVEGLE